MVLTRRPAADSPRTGDLLLKHGLATPGELRAALARQRVLRKKSPAAPQLGEILIERSVLSKDQLLRILEEQDRRRGLVNLLENGRGGTVILQLSGSMDDHRGESVRLCLDRLLDKGQTRFIVDGAGLDYVNSRGFSIIIAYVDECRSLGGDIKFASLSGKVEALFRDLGIDHFVQICRNTAEAEEAFGRSIDRMMNRGSVSEYIAGDRGRSFHLAYCSLARKIGMEDQLLYRSRQDALQAGKIPCPKCCP